MKNKYKSFETDRLKIKPTVLEDAEFVLKILNSKKWIRFIGDRNVRTIQGAREYIELKMLPQLRRLGYSS